MENRIYKLKNGLRIANFSSPHSFTFTTGEILPAVDDELATRMMLEVEETPQKERHVKFNTVTLDWSLSEDVADYIDLWWTFYNLKKIDIVIVPLPVMTALHSIWNDKDILKSPFRVIRVANRITKEIYVDKFCI